MNRKADKTVTPTQLPDVTDVTVPVLLPIRPLGVTVAAYTDGFDDYLADQEIAEIAAHSQDGSLRITRRRAGGWQIEPGTGLRPVILTRALIQGRIHYQSGPAWPCRETGGKTACRQVGASRVGPNTTAPSG